MTNYQGLQCFIYARISSENQRDSTSIQTQFDICAQLANLLKMKIAMRNGQTCSAYRVPRSLTTDRPKTRGTSGLELLRNMIAVMPRGSAVLVYRTDRFCRNQRAFMTLRQLMDERNIRLIVCRSNEQNPRMLDSDSTIDMALIEDEVRVAENEARAIGQRVMAAIRYRSSLGFTTLSKAKFGTKFVKKTIEGVEGRVVVPSTEEQEIIERIRRLMMTNFEKPAASEIIADILNSAGVTNRGARFTAKMVEKIYDQSMDDTCCNKCGKDTGAIWICEKCARGFHTEHGGPAKNKTHLPFVCKACNGELEDLCMAAEGLNVGSTSGVAASSAAASSVSNRRAQLELEISRQEEMLRNLRRRFEDEEDEE